VLRRLLAVVVVVAVLAVAWVGVRGYLAVRHLDDAAATWSQAQDELVALDVTAATESVQLIQDDTSAARDLTSDPVWNLVGRFPWGGQNLRATATGAAVGDDLARDALPAALVAATAVGGIEAGLRSGDLNASAEGATTLSEALVSLQSARDDARADLAAVDRRYLAPQVRTVLDDVEASLDRTDQIGAGLADAQ